MYKSPIELIMESVEEQFEAAVLNTIRENYKIIIDGEELIRALNYDRNQYEKGYADALAETQKTGKWIDSIDDGWFCSNCGSSISSRYGKYSYCPECGARMVE